MGHRGGRGLSKVGAWRQHAEKVRRRKTGSTASLENEAAEEAPRSDEAP
jgi:hypothetical protein